MSRNPLIVNVLDLVRQPAHKRSVDVDISVEELGVVDARLRPSDIVEVRILLDSLTDGIAISGEVRVPWAGECRRCLEPIERMDVSQIQEIAAVRPTDEDMLPIVGDQLDLEPIVREAVLLDLPLAPLCRPDCLGLCPVCGTDRNEGDCGHDDRPVDPRWAALGDLFPPPSPS
ncbi:MAG: DUF177 domain-containing protein [Acidimicrobiia bacterium]